MILIALLAAHALADYPLQGDFLSKAKNRTAPIPGVPWQQALGAHVVIHGAAVALITGLWWLFFAEAAIHWLTDDAKCRGKIDFNADQSIHIVCKIVWWCLAVTLA
ncbi:DUF3307 domain-containing protein [Novosphingobium sp. KA1]|uniref:DUF3307 domain-containing protein n=1 Tax=Novosphingobium sp. (strain KA1) TaxID=164608 RepID=UPI001A8E4BF3|nr:DUF3307 domain-containing protein [Novosphingobium sp. KA1]